MSFADKTDGVVGNKDLGLQVVLWNQFEHRSVAVGVLHHITSAHLEIKHQARDGCLHCDAREKHLGLTNLPIQAGDAIEIGFDRFSQLGFAVPLIGTLTRLQADQLLLFRIVFGAEPGHLGLGFHHLKLTGSSLAL